MNEVARALAFGPTALALVPAGSGNGLGRELGVPFEPAGALALAAGGRRRRIDVGEVNGEYFFNVAGVGLDATHRPGVRRAHRAARASCAMPASASRAVLGYRAQRGRGGLGRRRLVAAGAVRRARQLAAVRQPRLHRAASLARRRPARSRDRRRPAALADRLATAGVLSRPARAGQRRDHEHVHDSRDRGRRQAPTFTSTASRAPSRGRWPCACTREPWMSWCRQPGRSGLGRRRGERYLEFTAGSASGPRQDREASLPCRPSHRPCRKDDHTRRFEILTDPQGWRVVERADADRGARGALHRLAPGGTGAPGVRRRDVHRCAPKAGATPADGGPPRRYSTNR